MTTPIRVLVQDDRPADAELMLLELQRAGFEPDCKRVDTEQEYLANLDPEVDIILSDYSLPTESRRGSRLASRPRGSCPGP